jgi:hypothetical protein
LIEWEVAQAYFEMSGGVAPDGTVVARNSEPLYRDVWIDAESIDERSAD